MRKLVSILLLLFILVSLGESKIVVTTWKMSNLTDVFKENLEINKLRKDDPRVKNARIFRRRGYRDNI